MPTGSCGLANSPNQIMLWWLQGCSFPHQLPNGAKQYVQETALVTAADEAVLLPFTSNTKLRFLCEGHSVSNTAVSRQYDHVQPSWKHT
jgi:hypothetical protein